MKRLRNTKTVSKKQHRCEFTNFLLLNPEVISNIMLLLGIDDLLSLKNLASTCKTLNDIFNSKFLWRNIWRIRFLNILPYKELERNSDIEYPCEVDYPYGLMTRWCFPSTTNCDHEEILNSGVKSGIHLFPFQVNYWKFLVQQILTQKIQVMCIVDANIGIESTTAEWLKISGFYYGVHGDFIKFDETGKITDYVRLSYKVALPDDPCDYYTLEIGFLENIKPVSKSWRKRGASADFIYDLFGQGFVHISKFIPKFKHSIGTTEMEEMSTPIVQSSFFINTPLEILKLLRFKPITTDQMYEPIKFYPLDPPNLLHSDDDT